MDSLQKLLESADLIHNLPFEVNLWKPQNTYHQMLTEVLPDMHVRAGDGDQTAKAWVEKFNELGSKLGFRNGNAN